MPNMMDGLEEFERRLQRRRIASRVLACSFFAAMVVIQCFPESTQTIAKFILAWEQATGLDILDGGGAAGTAVLCIIAISHIATSFLYRRVEAYQRRAP